MEGSLELSNLILKELKWNLDGGYLRTLEDLNKLYVKLEDSEEMRSCTGSEEERRSLLMKLIKNEKASAISLTKVLFLDNERVLQLIYIVLSNHLIEEDFIEVPNKFDINSTYDVVEDGCTTTYCGRLFLMNCLSKRGEILDTYVKKLRKLSSTRNQIMHALSCYPNCRLDAMFTFNYLFTRDILLNEKFNNYLKSKCDGVLQKSCAFV